MKLSLSAIFLLAFAPVSSDAIQCGGALTSSCLADTDIRYDADVSNSFDSQSPYYGKMHGYYIGEGTFQNTMNEVQLSGTVSVAENITIVGSRQYIHRLTWVQIPIAGTSWFFSSIDSFATTSFEKDGTGDIFSVRLINGPPDITSKEGFRVVPADENSAFFGSFFENENTGPLVNSLKQVESSVILSKNTYSSVLQLFNGLGGEYSLIYSESSTKTRVTADEYIARINDIQDNKVVDTKVTLPMLGCWDSENCPTEEDWQKYDPNFAESPYQEPPATVKGGAIAGFAVAGIFLLLAVNYLIHLRKMAVQKKSIQMRIIRGLAQNITIGDTPGKLDADALLKEFNHLDNDKGGTISKDEMTEWLKNGKLGEISKSDFNAMWSAMDVDGNGEVDFIEFSTYLSGCGEAFDEVFEERKKMSKDEKMAKASQRLSVMEVSEADIEALETLNE